MSAGRVFSGLIATLLLAGACDSTGAPQVSSSGSPSPSPLDRPEPLVRENPPPLEGNLTPKALRGCLYQDQIDPASYAGLYSNVRELIAGQVEVSRALQFDAPAVELLDPKTFDRAVAAFDVDVSEEEELTTKFLAWALGITPFGLNVNRFFRGNDSGLIAGFYDLEDKSIAVERKGKLDAEYIVMAHEFAHAATDQAFGIPKQKNVASIVDDQRLAQSSLVEGDASLAELRVVSRLSPREDLEKAIVNQIEFKDAFAEGRSGRVPYLLIDTAVFPYRWGLAFACEVFKEKGWGGINRAYARPPTTTAQILFPERFLDRERALRPAELDKPGREWQLRDQGQLGAAHLKAMFEAPGDNENASLTRPLARAASWAGGEYKVWTRGKKTGDYTTGISLVEHEHFPGVLCDSMYLWYRAAFADDRLLVDDRVMRFEGPDQDAFLTCRGRRVMLGVSPTLAPAKAVIGLG